MTSAEELLTWSHATNSIEKIQKAFKNPSITAIECDILMGVSEEGETASNERNLKGKDEESNSNSPTSTLEPILSHPPDRVSDASTLAFLRLVSKHTNTEEEKKQYDDLQRRRCLQKHIKLDFKEIEALQPTLNQIRDLNVTANPLQKSIFLNADILPGPGRRKDKHVRSDIFLQTCIEHIHGLQHVNEVNYSLSLGYKVDYLSDTGYQHEDVDCMSALVHRFNLAEEKSIGLVLALNARVLAKNPSVFDEFLNNFSQSRILAWTGTGEPKIPKTSIDMIVKHFQSKQQIERIGFDCDIEEQRE